jgi:Na+/H+ antiporter NhaD/arsenite permease-like protein
VDATVLLIFVFVYAGMMLGGIPGLALDRSGVALLGAIALLATNRITLDVASRAVDLPTMSLLFGLMVVSAQFHLGGFYTHVTRRIVAARVSAWGLLALLILISGVLSALLANDIVCLAVAPVLVEACARRKLDPVPFLLALACAANVGSAATLIGNPQNMLVGEALHLSFAGYLLEAALPAVLGLAAVWVVVVWQTGDRWTRQITVSEISAPRFDRWQSGKGLVLLLVLVGLFLFSAIPRGVMALTVAGVLLVSRRTASRDILGLVDWPLLVLFAGLFVVNHALAASGTLQMIFALASAGGVALDQPVWLFSATAVLSNLVSNVPAVMLLLPVATNPMAGPILALASTLAGNLLVVGSIANIIVIEQARRLGIEITWRDHARIGIPVTVITLAVTALWLWVRAVVLTG